jgi:hypothetical protein
MSTVHFASTAKKGMCVLPKGAACLGKIYRYNQWINGDWNLIATTIGSDAPMEFDALSSDGLYWLIESEGDREERPFTIEEGEIIRW